MKISIMILMASFIVGQAFGATSDVERQDKKYMANAYLYALEFGTTSAAVEGGMYLDSDTILSVKYTQLLNASSTTVSGFDTNKSEESKELWDKAGKGFAFSVEYKKFVSRTFYVKPSLYYRSQYIVQSTRDSLGVLTKKKAGSTYDSGLSLKIGNQWQWEKFTLGCDWAGVSQQIVEFEGTGNLSDGDVKTNLSLLNFYVGASF